ncbi:MAG: helix-turn-helix domain-containing protein [Ignavibacteria bacterium]|nr:helix-turn-helix domain-containing protein [Ignavibacteria bacterium]
MKQDKLLLNFGERVRSLRKALKLSQEELASRAGLHRTYIGMIERAEKNVTLTNIQKVARALGVSIKDLF